MAFIKRNSERKAVSQPALIYARDRALVCDCIVKDISHTGARLKINMDENGAASDVPNEFILSFTVDEAALDDNFSVIRRCRTMWVRKNEIGVAFLGRGKPAQP